MIDDVLLDCVYGKWCLDGIPFDGSSTADGDFFHYENGYLHREDGPAIELENGYKAWYLHGEYITTWKEYHEKTTLSPQEQMVVKLRYGEELK